MSTYNEIMKDPFLSRQVLIEFGFGAVKPIKVERWVKKNYPNLFYKCRREANKNKIVQLEVEQMSKERRDSILDKEEVFSEIVRGDI